MKLAAIDIGSNSIKLAVADAVDSDSFAVLTREKDVVRLGHETLRKGRLSRAAIDRAIGSIQRFKTIADTHKADAIVTDLGGASYVVQKIVRREVEKMLQGYAGPRSMEAPDNGRRRREAE